MDQREMMDLLPVNPKVSEALKWYTRAIEKVAKRYHKAMGTSREQKYMDVHTKLCPMEEEIDEVYREYLAGQKTIEDFKSAIRVWFKEIMAEWTKVDKGKPEQGSLV